MRKGFLWLAAWGALLLPGLRADIAAPLGEAEFAKPPRTYDAGAFWFWMNGNISKEGITRDLEAYHAKGVRYLILYDVGGGPQGPVKMMSEEWLALVRHAAAEAKRLDLVIGPVISPGWGQGGGPWITPELSMKRVVWSARNVEGGKPVSLSLPPLPATDNWAKDSCVAAWPTDKAPPRLEQAREILCDGAAVDKTVLCDGNPNTFLPGPKKAEWTMKFSFDAPYAAEKMFFSLTHRIWWKGTQVGIRITGDGALLAEKQLKVVEMQQPFTIPFPHASAREYQVSLKIINEPGAPAGFDFGTVKLAEAELLDGGESPQWGCELADWGQQIEDSEGSATKEGVYASATPLPPVPQSRIVDLTSQVQDGTLTWQAPAGRWRVVRFGYTTTGEIVHPTRPGGLGLEGDKLNAAASELHFKSYIGRILEAVGPENRQGLGFVEADSWESGQQNWTDDFAPEFRKRRGYEIAPWMPVLAGETVGSRAETLRFLNDFRQTIADLMTERFYGRTRELIDAAGLQFYGEIPAADITAWARNVDLPMWEIWSDTGTGALPPVPQGAIAPCAVAQGAFLADKPVLPIETFTSWKGDWRWTPGRFGYISDIAFCLGFNRIILHHSVHQPDDRVPGFTMGGIGQHFNRHNTWWPLIDGWLDTIRRKQYLLQQGQPVFDLLVYNGDSMPLENGDLQGGQLPRRSHPLGIDFPTLVQRVTVKDGKLQVDGKGDYWCLVLPATRQLRLETLQKVAALVKAGVTVFGQPPDRTPGLSGYPACDAQLQQLSRDLWEGLSEGSPTPHKVGAGQVFWTKNIAQVLKGMGYEADLADVTRPDTRQGIQYVHRRTGATDFYYLYNLNEQKTGFTVRLADAENRQPEAWDPVDGSIRSLAAGFHEKGRAVFPLTLEGRAGLFVVLRHPEEAGALPLRAARLAAQDADPFSGADGVVFERTAQGISVSGEAGPIALAVETGGGKALSVTPPPPRELAVDGPFQVSFLGLSPVAAVAMPQPVSWTELADEKEKNYSGVAAYDATVDVPEAFLKDATRVDIDLGEVAKVARVTVNGRVVGTLWQAPWRLPVGAALHAGGNALHIEVANTWFNRLMADSKLPENQRTTWTTWNPHYWTDIAAKPELSGLLQAPKLIAMPSVPVGD